MNLTTLPRTFRNLAASFGLLFLLTLLLAAPLSLSAQDSSLSSGKTIIILDASGSMWGQIKGRPKIEIARETIGKLLQNLPPDLELGLMAYGHRIKGDCGDIELLIPPGKVNRETFLERVNSIIPVGKTPLTDAVEAAANFLKYEENPANVILVSDGLETCDRDPCVLADKLAARGIAFRAHIVAFDLTNKEANTFRCLSDKTGGQFLQAQDAHTLFDALVSAFEAVAKAGKEMEPEPEPIPANIKAPAEVPAGSLFPVEWEGPDRIGDYLTIVAKGTEDGEHGNFEYTKNGSPAELTAPIAAGACEIRYMTGRQEILARADVVVTPVSATLEAPASAVAGSYIPVKWSGPDNEGDRIVILSAGESHGIYDSRARTSDGNPATVRATSDPGDTVIQYISGLNDVVLGSVPIKIVEADVSVTGPEVVDAGAKFEVKFKGPANSGDKVMITVTDPEKGNFEEFSHASSSNDGTLTLLAPETPGDFYELRYVEGQDDKVLFGVPILVKPVNAWVKVPEVAVAGSEIEVEWGGPTYSKVVVTIVEKSAPENTYGDDFSTSSSNSPGKLTVMENPCEAEIRFVSAQGNTLARTPVTVIGAEISLSAAEKAVAGSTIEVKWTGLKNDLDRITLAVPGSESHEFVSQRYSTEDQTVELDIPENAGEYEIRYVTGRAKKILARRKVSVLAE